MLDCDNIRNIFQLELAVSASIKSVDRNSDRGSLESDIKSHTLRGRWIDKNSLKSKSVPHASMRSVVYGIERHTIVSRGIKFGCGKASHMVTKMYRVLSILIICLTNDS